MSELSKSSVKLQRLLMLDSDMAAAAQQLMQLSDEDSNNNRSNSNDNDNKIKTMIDSKRLFEQSQGHDEITSAKIEEIFGKEEEILRPTKKRRYRFLDSIYKKTKPIKVSNCKNYGIERKP